jgi:hypothetical protein
VKKLLLLACAAVCPLVVNPVAHGQAEIAPDHYETADSQSRPPKADTKAKAMKIHYEGNFTLPHSVQCDGKNLSPGDYSVALDSDGSTVRLTLNRKDQAIRIEGVPEKQPRYRGRDALLVRRTGHKRELSAIHIAQLELVFHPLSQGEQRDGVTLRGVEALPVTLATSK